MQLLRMSDFAERAQSAWPWVYDAATGTIEHAGKPGQFYVVERDGLPISAAECWGIVSHVSRKSWADAECVKALVVMLARFERPAMAMLGEEA